MTIQEYLKKKGFEFRRAGEQAIFNCPFCEDTEHKFAISLVSGLWQCFHKNKCGLSGNFYDLQKKLNDTPQKISNSGSFVGKKKKEYTVPSQDIPQMPDDLVGVYNYLKGRGFSDETIKHFRTGAEKDTVIFPYFKNGVIVNKKYRNITNKKDMRQEKDAEAVLFNRDNIASNTLILTEGEMDTYALHEYGVEATSVPSGCTGLNWVDNEWDYLETFKRIVICFDMDDAGHRGAMALASRLGLWRCSIVELPYKDVNECLLKKVSTDEIIKCLINAKELTPETVVSPKTFVDRVKYLFEMGSSLFGVPTIWPELTDKLKGWRGGEVTIWSGRNGAGKSTILNQIFIDLAERGEKICIYSGEMSPDRYLRWAVVQYLECPEPRQEDIESALDWMDEKVYILDITSTIEVDKLLADFEYAARRYGVKHFIIDSLMKVKLNLADEYNEQQRFVSRLTDFVKVFDAHVHLVAHPRKTATDRDEPGKVDVKGSSHITDLAHNVIIIYRIDEEAKDKSAKKFSQAADAYLYIKKNREFGIEGRVLLSFDTNTKLYTTPGMHIERLRKQKERDYVG
jgi:twinkle protein